MAKRKTSVEKLTQTSVPASMSVMLPADVQDNSQALIAFAERLVTNSNSISLQECFAAAVDLPAYLTAVRNKSIIAGSKYVPKTVQVLGELATKGDLEAAKFLFDFLGLKSKAPAAQINTQVNIQTPTLRDLITIDAEGNIVGE